MTDKERIMDKLYGAVAGLFLVYGISTEEYVGKNIIDLLNEAEKQFQFKEQECEKLKNQVDEDYNYYTTELKTLRDIISNKEKRNAALFLTSGRYRKALDKIEGLIKNFCKDCSDYEDCNWDKEGCYYSLIPNLKDIINKAGGNGYEIL